MTPGFSSDFKELVRSRTDLAELVGETISLSPKHGGSDYVGLCPFHQDRNPSFHVYPARQSWRCWVCDEGGDCFSFVMKIEGVEFREALEMLASRAHLEMPRTLQKGTGPDRSRKNSLYEALTWAERQLHEFLLESPGAERARGYLAERGFTHESLLEYRVGYHPDNHEWLLGRARDRFTPAQLFAARLVRERRDGSGYYDDFVDRVMFPIHDVSGRCVAFGGRVLPDNPRGDDRKYLNSPESAVFSKSSLLYGLDVAKEPIRRSQTAVVMEGYTDCIMSHQYGVENVVSVLGTALTDAHVTLLKRFARKVVLIYDGDEAGQRAAERSLARFLAQDVDLRILNLPNQDDPADYLAAHGADAFRELIERAAEVWEYQLQLSIRRHGLETTDGRQRVLDAMLELLSQAPGVAGTTREDILLNRLSQRLGVNERTVRQQLSGNRKKRSAKPAERIRIDGADGEAAAGYRRKHEQLERELLQIILTDPTTVETCRHAVQPDEFYNPELKQILELCYGLAGRDLVPTVERVIAEIEQPELKRLVVRLDDLAREHEIEKKLKDDGPGQWTGSGNLLDQTIQNLKWRREEQSHQASKGQLAALSAKTGAPDGEAKDLLRRAAEFHKERVTKRP